MKEIRKCLIAVAALMAVTLFVVEGSYAAAGGISLASLGFLPLVSECGIENMGGMKNRLAFIPLCDVSAVPLLPASPATDEDLVTATGSFELKSDGKPVYIYATDKTVKFTSENQGETDGQSFKQSGEFFYPGNKTAAAAFARKINNTPGYLILEDPEGNQYIVGQPGLPCTLKPSFDFGQARTDRRGFKFTFEADSFCPFIRLAAPIDFDELLEEPEQI
ncbi:MAG: hypothetical protein LBI65_01765 [Candidatus Symbiothrix sp.]|jgi:hypothetical protein|nr:hypothetical protein [Candidatus Symbiothrix sp.]